MPLLRQKRTLLLGEYLSEDLVLQLPHRQFVFTIPKCLRVYLKHDRALHAELSRHIFRLLTEYFSEAAGRKITAGMVSSLQTFGEYAGWNPHWHLIVLDGGFDRYDRFVYIPIRTSEKLEKLYWDSDTDTVLWHAPNKGHFRGQDKYFPCLDFIARITMHLPPKGKHLVRRYGIYSSGNRGTWKRRPALTLRAAEGWYGWEECAPPVEAEAGEEVMVTARTRRKAWARLLAKVYEIDVLQCPQCGGEMSVIAIIREPTAIRDIIACLKTKGRGPP